MKKLPPCLYLKNGSYYYVVRDAERKKVWTNLGRDRESAVSAATELNKQKRAARAELFGRMRSVYGKVRDSILGRDEYKCVYCGATDNLELDHFIPFERGGSSTPCNLVTACADCNASKNGTDPKRFLVEIDALRKHLAAEVLDALRRDSAKW
jgi:predicted aminopeptidase